MRDLDHEPTPHLPIWELIRREVRARQEGLRVEVEAISDVGRVRDQNEDHFLVLRLGRSLEALASNLPADHLPPRLERAGYALIVADGVGGRSGGEHASARALTALVEIASQIPDWILDVADLEDESAMRRAVSYFEKVDAILEAEAAADPALRGMGTTMTAAYLLDRHLLVAHVGDSRAYRFRNHRLERLTRDQTLAQALADAGVIGEAEVASHSQRHVLTGALGASPGTPRVEFGRHDVADGDRILVASDGLTEMVPDEAIAAILAQRSSAKEAVRELVDAALAAGGRDNVTVVLASCSFTTTG